MFLGAAKKHMGRQCDSGVAGEHIWRKDTHESSGAFPWRRACGASAGICGGARSSCPSRSSRRRRPSGASPPSRPCRCSRSFSECPRRCGPSAPRRSLGSPGSTAARAGGPAGPAALRPAAAGVASAASSSSRLSWSPGTSRACAGCWRTTRRCCRLSRPCCRGPGSAAAAAALAAGHGRYWASSTCGCILFFTLHHLRKRKLCNSISDVILSP